MSARLRHPDDQTLTDLLRQRLQLCNRKLLYICWRSNSFKNLAHSNPFCTYRISGPFAPPDFRATTLKYTNPYPLRLSIPPSSPAFPFCGTTYRLPAVYHLGCALQFRADKNKGVPALSLHRSSPRPAGLNLWFRLAGSLIAIFLLAPFSRAQAVSASDLEDAGLSALTTNDAGPVGIVPLTRGFNLSLIAATQHDSSNGWSTVFTPTAAWRFDQRFSFHASTPLFAYINILQTKGPRLKPIYTQTTQQGVPGDTSLDLQFALNRAPFAYSTDVSLGLPTGDKNYGLGAGQPTYDFNNHFERSFRALTPDIELGFGDSSSLIGQRIRKSYTAVGPIAHFQAGSSLDLPFGLNFESDAYEQLPLSHDTIYSTTKRGKKKVRTVTTQGAAEDNGFLNTLDIPASSHITFSAFYNRSLRSHDDLAGLSLTLFLRPIVRHEILSR